MTKRITIANVAVSILLQIVTIISGFIIPRIILSAFGSEVNGLVSSINQFLEYIALVEGGITSVILASLYGPLSKKDNKKISSVVSAANNFFKKIAIIFVGYTIILSLIYPLIVKSSFSYGYICILTLILSINLFMQYFFSLTWKTLLRADKKIWFTSLVQIICVILNTLAVVIIIRVWPNIHFLKLFSALVFVLQPLLFSLYIDKHYEIDRDVEPDKKALSQRWNGFGINVAGFIHNNTDVVVLSVFTNLLTVSVYSVYHMVSNSLKKLIGSISEGVIPTLGHAYAKGDSVELNNIFDSYELVLYYMTFILFTAGGILITPFIMVYTKGITDVNYYQPLFGWIIILAEMTHCIKDPYVNMAYCAGKFKDISKHAYIESCINIFLSIALVPRYGLIGVAIGTLAAMIYRTAFHIIYLKNNILNRPIFKTIKSLLIFGSGFVIVLLISYNLFSLESLSVYSWILLAVLNTILVVLVYSIITLLFYRNRIKDLLGFFKIKKFQKENKKTVFILFVILLLYVTGFYYINNVDYKDYREALIENKYIAHALGGIDNNTYTNSLEALNNSYEKGFRLFEVDVRFTSDNKLVCVHGWSANDYKNKIGIDYNGIMTYEMFINSKIKGKYTTISFEDITKFIAEKKDVYFMIDIGKQSYSETKKIYNSIINSTDKKLLNHLIVGGHTSDMIKAVKESYNFKIVNLYWADANNRTDEQINTKEKFLEYCKKNKIISLSTSVETYNNEKETIEYFKKNGLIVYVFTENNEKKAIEYLQTIDVVGTDFIVEDKK